MSQLNRRNALTAVASLPVLAAPAVAIAAADSPDAELIALGREFDRLVMIANEYWRRVGEAHDRAEAMMGQPPDSLRPKFGDRKAGLRRPESFNVDAGAYMAVGMSIRFARSTIRAPARSCGILTCGLPTKNKPMSSRATMRLTEKRKAIWTY
jgi:hypothetical protein